MEQNIYEHHTYQEHDLPIIFNQSEIKYKRFYFHWHENLEILHFIDGQARVVSNAKETTVGAADTAVINSNDIHDVQVTDSPVKYYCLIIDKEFCDSFGFPIEEVTFQQKMSDPVLTECFAKIHLEMQEKKPYYKEAVKTEILRLLLQLFRRYQQKTDHIVKNSTKINMVKESMKYIKLHFQEPISLDLIAGHIGFSKYYFCRAFKDVTGYTVNSYINFLRANYAYDLIKKKKYTIGEIALLSGFESFSYFTKNFKKYIGTLPSKIH